LVVGRGDRTAVGNSAGKGRNLNVDSGVAGTDRAAVDQAEGAERVEEPRPVQVDAPSIARGDRAAVVDTADEGGDGEIKTGVLRLNQAAVVETAQECCRVKIYAGIGCRDDRAAVGDVADEGGSGDIHP